MLAGKTRGGKIARDIILKLKEYNVPYDMILKKNISPELILTLVNLAPNGFEDLFRKKPSKKKMAEIEEQTEAYSFANSEEFYDLPMSKAVEYVVQRPYLFKGCMVWVPELDHLIVRATPNQVEKLISVYRQPVEERMLTKKVYREVILSIAFNDIANEEEEIADEYKRKNS